MHRLFAIAVETFAALEYQITGGLEGRAIKSGHYALAANTGAGQRSWQL